MSAFSTITNLPNLGLGLGLRSKHFDHILKHHPHVDWFEIISENFMDSGGRPMNVLEQIAELYPIVMHGVSMSIGSTDPLNMDYLQKLKALTHKIQPAWVSDHLCWTGVLSLNTHDLLPLPLNEETLSHVCHRILQVQDFLERPLVLENPSTYMSFQNSTLNEWEFLSEMVSETNCGLLLDVNNVYVSAFNNDFDAKEYLNGIPWENVVQLHLAGHQHCGDYIIDTHDGKVINPVWELFSIAWQKTQGVSTLLEWDNHIPEFDEYHSELLKAKTFMEGFEHASEDEPKPRATDASNVSNPVSHLVPHLSKEIL